MKHQCLDLDPIQRLANKIRHEKNLLADQPIVSEAFYDYVPTSATSLELLVLQDKKISVSSGSFKKLKERKVFDWWEYDWAKKPSEVIDATFHSPFIVIPRPKSYFFVTQLCELYGLKDNGKGGRITYAIWNKEDQPIARLITDNATGKTFAFTLPLERKDGTKARPCYFELSDKPELIEYDPVKMKKNDFPYPYKQIRECVDVLLADKKIDPEKHRPKEKPKDKK